MSIAALLAPLSNPQFIAHRAYEGECRKNEKALQRLDREGHTVLAGRLRHILDGKSGELDLRGCTFPPKHLWEQVRSRVTCFTTQEGMTRLNAVAFKQMPALRTLVIPNFRGEEIDLRGLEKLKHLQAVELTNTLALRVVHAPAGIHVRASGVLPEEKVRVQRYAGNGEWESTQPLHGQLYLASTADGIDRRHLNKVATFADSNKFVVCRHLSTYEALTRARYLQARKENPQIGNLAEYRKSQIGTLDAIAAIPSKIEARYREVWLGAARNFEVGNTQWNRFLGDEFEHMKIDEERQYLVSTISHVLHLALKRDHEGCVLRLYDPNLTLTHRRIVQEKAEHLTFNPCELQGFNRTSRYGGADSQVTLVQQIPPSWSSKADPLAPVRIEGRRSVRSYLSSSEELDHGRARLRLEANLPVDHLHAALQSCTTTSDIVHILDPHDGRRASPLALAIKRDSRDAVKSIGAALLSVRDRVGAEVLEQLLQARNTHGLQALHVAMGLNHSHAIASYMELLARAFEQGALHGDQVERLIAGTVNGPLLIRAASGGNALACATFISHLLQLVERNAVSAAAAHALLGATDSKGHNALHIALAANDGETCRALIDGLCSAQKQGVITAQQLADFLRRGNATSSSERCVGLYLDAVHDLARDGVLGGDEVSAILTPKHGGVVRGALRTADGSSGSELLSSVAFALRSFAKLELLTQDQAHDILSCNPRRGVNAMPSIMENADVLSTSAWVGAICEFAETGQLNSRQFAELIVGPADNPLMSRLARAVAQERTANIRAVRTAIKHSDLGASFLRDAVFEAEKIAGPRGFGEPQQHAGAFQEMRARHPQAWGALQELVDTLRRDV